MNMPMTFNKTWHHKLAICIYYFSAVANIFFYIIIATNKYNSFKLAAASTG